MVRFIHSADWQLGARFAQFGSRGGRLREARLETLKRALDLGRQHQIDAFIIAGDLFEDNQVDDALVNAVVSLFAGYTSFGIYLLPGNHDPFAGPESIWQRKALISAPSHVKIFREAGTAELGGNAFIVASPLHQKLSTIDPSLKLVELAATLPAGSLKIGVTHGSLAIEGMHNANDFPIALNAATRAGLDYLGVGHWHNWLADTDGGRLVMPGTPEPDRFSNENRGHVALVEIPAAGEKPRVQAIPVSTLAWREFAFDFLSADSSRATLSVALAELAAAPSGPATGADHSVFRVTLNGTASPAALAETRTWVEEALKPFLVGQLVDKTTVALTAIELTDLQARHPILAQVLSDIDRLETLATGVVATPALTLVASDAATTSGSAVAPSPATAVSAAAPLTLAEAQALLAPSKIDLAKLTPTHFAQLRQLLLQSLQEAAK